MPEGRRAGFTMKMVLEASVVIPKLYPACRAAKLASRTMGRRANLVLVHSLTGSRGRWKSQAKKPKATKLRERSTDRPLTLSDTASLVMVFMGISIRSYWLRLPSIKGLSWYPALARPRSSNALVVHDQGSTLAEVGDVRFEGCRIHGHHAVGLIARSGDVPVRDLDLKGRNSGKGTRRGPDLGRKAGQGVKIVAEGRRGVSEAIPGQLHSVPRVAREADSDLC